MISIGICFVIVFIGALALRLPVAFGIVLTALIMFFVNSGGYENPAFLIQRFFGGIDSFPLLAVPLFLVTGKIMNSAGITRRIYAFADNLVGHMRLGLGQVNIVASLIFAGMSGAAVADAAGLGLIEIRSMNDAGYDRKYSAALTAASSVVGPIIPPSIPIVLYGIMAQTSIGSLLIAGIIPGIIICILLMIMNEKYGQKNGYQRGKFGGMKKLLKSFGQSFLGLLTPVILIGGFLTGIFTPTEAAAIALLYAIIIGFMVYREITMREIFKIFKESMRDTTELTIIVGAAAMLAYVIIDAEIPQTLVRGLSSITSNKWIILFLINIFLLIIGCFLEPAAAITIVVPVLMPLIHQFGIDPIHFGIIVVFNLVIGLLTPPVGLILFVISKIADISVKSLIKALIPFYVLLFIALIIITYVPIVTTFLPRILLGN